MINKIGSKWKRGVTIALAVIMLLGVSNLSFFMGGNQSNAVYAAGDWLPTISSSGDESVTQGSKATVIYTIKNNFNQTRTINKVSLAYGNASGLTVSGGSSGSTALATGEEMSVAFTVSASKSASTGNVSATLTIEYDGGSTSKQTWDLTVYEFLATPDKPGSGNYVTVADITHKIKPSEGFSPGAGNEITFELYNNGNSVIKNAQLALTLPEGISVYNSSNSENLGYISTGQKRTVTFPIYVDDTVAGKNYAVETVLSGLSYTNTEVSTKKTFYIPVSGSGSLSTKNLEINNISIPAEVEGEKDFKMSFQVKNSGTSTVKNMKVYADVPEGLINKTKSAFVESSIAPGASKSYSITLFSKDSTEKTYPIKIGVEPLESKDGAGGTIQYASVYVKNGSSSNAKTPQLMVSNYSYGGTYVQSGTEFRLNLTLYNTSGKNLTNIKTTLSSAEGNFIPSNSSNAFFIESISKKSRAGHSILLKVKTDAKQGTAPIDIEMTYEDGAGNAFTAKDTISIPVVQDERLVVDDILSPPELYIGNPSSVTVQFYNMGKGVLQNLRATAIGDFDTMESVNYFVGNMEPGKSDSYDFTMVPRRDGAMIGSVVFTYEDASGNEQSFEKPFEFQVMGEMPVFEENPGEVPVEPTGIKKYLKWIIGGGVIAVIAGIVVAKKIRKKKKHQEMEIDE